MARKTKAELSAEAAIEQAQRLEVAKASYTERMMAVFRRGCQVDFELSVSPDFFVMEDRDERRRTAHFVHPAWCEMADVVLYELEMAVELKEEERAEREQKAQRRATALAKLTPEEREELGL